MTARARRNTRPTSSAADVPAPPLIEISAEHQRLVDQTKAFQKTIKTMKDQRAWINSVIKFIFEKYPQHGPSTVVRVTP